MTADKPVVNSNPGEPDRPYDPSPGQRETPRNPKLAPDPGSNAEKDPDQWVSGDEPMTGAQASYLKTLSEETNEAEMFEENLTKAEASRRIDALKAKANLR